MNAPDDPRLPSKFDDVAFPKDSLQPGKPGPVSAPSAERAVAPLSGIIPIKAVASLLPQRAAADGSEESLYEVHHKIYPRALTGWFASWRWTLVWFTQLLFYGLPWLNWNGRQAVLFDLVARKFYIFGFVFWPQDLIFLTALLICSALGLFLFTAVGGRLWCGYACPQTVYTEIFLWIERKVEGDRPVRMKLDAQPMNIKKFTRKFTKHAIWIGVGLATGMSFVGYFTPIRTLVAEIVSLQTSGWETFWILFYGAATYGNAGFMREQVCKYMCPYARFQSAMFDKDTLIITYDAQRGEPRGKRKKGGDLVLAGLGECVDCGVCVQVCPTGIDIRNGLQYECIGCAACVDGCNQIMDKMGYPRGLVRYTTSHAMANGWSGAQVLKHVLRPRVLVYSSILATIMGATVVALLLRVPLKVDLIRDRGVMAREVVVDHQPGWIENAYRMQIMNLDEKPHHYQVQIDGLDGLKLEESGVSASRDIALRPTETRTVALTIQDPPHGATPGSHPIHVTVKALDEPAIVRHELATFYVPAS